MSERGLTLVEVLVALFIMAVLAVLSWRTVAAMTDTQTYLEDSRRRFDRLADAVDLMERDLACVVEAPGEPGLRGEGGEGGRYGELRFSRSGSGYRADAGIQQLGYRWQDGRLEKLLYPESWSLNAAAERRLLLEGVVSGLYFRFLDRSGQWQPRWPVATVTGLPRAVEARFLLAGGGEVRRVYPLP